MQEEFVRTEMLLGAAAMERLAAARVAVFGLGGVGGSAAEALVRTGIGAIDLIDNDRVSRSNLNRQIIATNATLGMLKAEAAARRFAEINPALLITCSIAFFTPETADDFDFTCYDYVVDAIDTVTGKLCLVQRCMEAGTPIISAMGTGNKLDPSLLRISDLSETAGCPLARIMRKELRKRGILHLPVVWSPEEPIRPVLPEGEDGEAELPQGRRSIPGSTAFVPAAAGLLLASRVVRDLIQH